VVVGGFVERIHASKVDVSDQVCLLARMLVLDSGLTESHEQTRSDLHTRREWPFVTVASKLTLRLVTIAKQFTVFRLSIAR
jgi:hypothetical protein